VGAVAPELPGRRRPAGHRSEARRTEPGQEAERHRSRGRRRTDRATRARSRRRTPRLVRGAETAGARSPHPPHSRAGGRNRATAPPARGTKRVNEPCSGSNECARGHCRNVQGRNQCVDCSPSAFDEVNAQIQSFCKGPPLSCRTLGPNPALALIDERIEGTTRCINARTRRENRCFGGGDKAHLFQISKVAAVRTLCRCLREALGNPDFSPDERAGRVRSCREVRGI
jgi:hypothetical protein